LFEVGSRFVRTAHFFARVEAFFGEAPLAFDFGEAFGDFFVFGEAEVFAFLAGGAFGEAEAARFRWVGLGEVERVFFAAVVVFLVLRLGEEDREVALLERLADFFGFGDLLAVFFAERVGDLRVGERERERVGLRPRVGEAPCSFSFFSAAF
jgi:hypothetical protein